MHYLNNRVVTPENSSDLSSGRRPLSQSDEFSGVTTLVVEIMRCKVTTFSEKVTYLSVDGSNDVIKVFMA